MRYAIFVLVFAALASCGMSKKEVLEAIRRDVKDEGLCTLPVEVISALKQQYATKAVCAAKTSKQAAECLAALASMGVTSAMPASYMLEWPDDLAGKSLAEVPAYERKARSELFSTCVELKDRLREGKIACATVEPSKVNDIQKVDATHKRVSYSRTVTYTRDLGALDRACGKLVRVPEEASVTLVKGEAGWSVERE